MRLNGGRLITPSSAMLCSLEAGGAADSIQRRITKKSLVGMNVAVRRRPMAVEDKRRDSDAPAKLLMKSQLSVMSAFTVLSLASNFGNIWLEHDDVFSCRFSIVLSDIDKGGSRCWVGVDIEIGL